MPGYFIVFIVYAIYAIALSALIRAALRDDELHPEMVIHAIGSMLLAGAYLLICAQSFA
jgi:hypothetical protein